MVRAAATDGNSEDPSHIFHKKHGDKLDLNLIPKETLADIFQFHYCFGLTLYLFSHVYACIY